MCVYVCELSSISYDNIKKTPVYNQSCVSPSFLLSDLHLNFQGIKISNVNSSKTRASAKMHVMTFINVDICY